MRGRKHAEAPGLLPLNLLRASRGRAPALRGCPGCLLQQNHRKPAKQLFLHIDESLGRGLRVIAYHTKNDYVWSPDHHTPPSSEKEFGRRNYVWKTFTWDQDGQMLAAVSKGGGKKRTVIIEDCIIEVVELVHTSNSHAGWDTTWRDVNHSS
ncbi:uncharacterized protein B0I36DRAFT_46156 [Microdochium trichocladiopsis]|uniref:Uncharacterized protein n=1 Tax=Microdochium trichocladiopsis TaxID=1682393 RepID=A0A9P9BJW3_9PEZI|nr:uncharacterized protein B0I36DRAFT_46156 [Microdochium trichocladiopsis]KAH7016434.1 hypothetical protein B0I36DRAFT_46156 [Microdochium trichocladiopsis]